MNQSVRMVQIVILGSRSSCGYKQILQKGSMGKYPNVDNQGLHKEILRVAKKLKNTKVGHGGGHSGVRCVKMCASELYVTWPNEEVQDPKKEIC